VGSGTGTNCGGTCTKKICCVPPVFAFTSTISCFSEHFCNGQYSLVTPLCFVLLLSVPLCPVICKSGGTRPHALWSRRHFPWDSFAPKTVTRTIFFSVTFKVMHRVILLTRFCKLLINQSRNAGWGRGHVPQWHDASVHIDIYLLTYLLNQRCPSGFVEHLGI